MTGELLNEATIETEAGEYGLALRFVDWDRPDHRDTQGHAVARYSIQITNPDGEKASFTGWGSIHEAQQGELSHTDAVSWAENVTRDGLMFYEECDGTHGDLDRPLTAEAIQGDMADMIDRLAAEMGIEEPSETVRVFGGLMQTARDLRSIGLDYHRLRDFYEAVREEIDG